MTAAHYESYPATFFFLRHSRIFLQAEIVKRRWTGQRKTTLLYGALPDSHASTPYFEYWTRKTELAAKLPATTFVHTSDAFRAAIASTGRQYYFRVDDVHWNDEGHTLFAGILERAIVNPAAGVN